MDAVLEIIGGLAGEFVQKGFGFTSRLNPLYLLAMIPIAYVLYRRREVKTSFWKWLFPSEIYKHLSTKTDLNLFVFGLVLKVAGFTKVTTLRIVIIYSITQLFGKTTAEPTFVGIIALTLILTVASDFCVYWVHRGHHELKIIWPFHAVHHSAEVMSPLTVYRKHPIYDIFSGLFRAVVIGIVQGLILSFFFGKISLAVIGGVTVTIMLFNVLGSNFRHSHIWISYGPFWSKFFISPAQHQIHHSLAHRHWHKNYGEILAIWDWMFGTLYVPQTQEELEFGLSTPDGKRIVQPYPTAVDALIKPFEEMATYLSPPTQPAPEDS